MKRRDLLKAGGFGILAFALRNLPAGGAMGGYGAVRLVLYKRIGDEDPNNAGDGEYVGWAIVSTTSDRQLRVLVTLDKGDPNAEYDIRVEIEGEYREEDVGTLSTNDRGTGSSRLLLNLSDYITPGRTINVQVEVEDDETDFASATATTPVPLKKKKKKKAKK